MPEEEFDTSQSDARTATQRVSELAFDLTGEKAKINELYQKCTKGEESLEKARLAFKKHNDDIQSLDKTLKKTNAGMEALSEEVARLTKLVEDKVSKEAENAAAQTENS